MALRDALENITTLETSNVVTWDARATGIAGPESKQGRDGPTHSHKAQEGLKPQSWPVMRQRKQYIELRVLVRLRRRLRTKKPALQKRRNWELLTSFA